MATDLEIAVDKITDMLSTSFDDFNTNNKGLDKETVKFWKKLKKRLPDDFVVKFEAEPKATAEEMKNQLLTLGENVRVKMNYVMYLHDMDVPLD